MSAVRRAGFVLLAMLWVMVGVSVAGLGIALVARRAATAARNRREETRAEWLAKDCLARARAVIGAVLAPPSAVTRGADPATWATLDRALAAPSALLPVHRCTVALHATGRTIDVNTADQEMLARLFAALGMDAAQTDSLVDALLDWRDPDSVPRPYGAEAAWYIGQGRAPPRNGPFASVRELHRVRGLEAMPAVDTLLGVAPGRIVLDRAPRAVLAALPGFTPEAVARVELLQRAGIHIGDLLAVASSLSPAARAALLARYPDLVRLTAPEPDAWRLTSRATVGSPPVTVAITLTLVRAGPRAAIVRRRMGVE